MKIKDKLEALVEERIDYVKELVIRDRYDELYEVIFINFGFDKLSEEEIEEQNSHYTKEYSPMPLTNKLEDYCPKDSNHKRVSFQPQATGSSDKPQANSSLTCLPRYKRQASLALTRIKVFSG